MGFPVVPADGEYRAAVRCAATRLAGLRQGECKDTQAQGHKPRDRFRQSAAVRRFMILAGRSAPDQRVACN